MRPHAKKRSPNGMAIPEADDDAPPFRRLGPATPASPVLLSVPHAGRDYPDSLLAAARIPFKQLQSLEDRLVDRLVWRAVAAGVTAIVATTPRAAIDLNRHEREMDPLSIAPPLPSLPFIQSARTRSGLGLVPSRHPLAGAIWRRRLTGAELEQRIAAIHRPFHAALTGRLGETRDLFGIAILIDCHSMPSRQDAAKADIVFGDRHGTSMAPHFRDAAMKVATEAGLRAVFNAPYAGGHITAAHGRPLEGIHALQIEIDRKLYLDSDLTEPGPGFDHIARLIATLADALASAAADQAPALAAE